MKYWCYYANVVRYLEKVEALFAPKTRGPAYLVWTDDDGPHMIAGPGIHWYRGDGPMPDLDSLEIPVSIRAPIRAATAREGSAHTRSTPKKKLRAARVSKRSPANTQSLRSRQNTAATAGKRSPANAPSTPTHRNTAATVSNRSAHTQPSRTKTGRTSTQPQSADARTQRTTQNPAAPVRPRSARRHHSPHRTTHQCRAATWRTPPARPVGSLGSTPAPPLKKRRTKGVQLFRNPLKPAHSPPSRPFL